MSSKFLSIISLVRTHLRKLKFFIYSKGCGFESRLLPFFQEQLSTFFTPFIITFLKIAQAMWRIWAPPLAIIFQLNHSCLIQTSINPREEWKTNLKKNLFSTQRESLVGLKLAWLSFFSTHNKTAKILNWR